MAPADDDSSYEIWKDDLFDRRADAEFLIQFLVSKSKEGNAAGLRSYVLNVDAGWGHGKTFFLNRFKETIEQRGYPVAYVNAWSDDHADDPLLPVMAAIDSAVRTKPGVKTATKASLGKLARIGGRVAIAAGKGALQQAAHRYVGEQAINAVKDLAGETAGAFSKSAGDEAGKKLGELYDAGGQALIDKFNRGKKSIEDFKKQLSHVLNGLEESARPLFVLVDELDRCRPTYAVALLERIKHIFEIDDVVFVLATDTDQLRHSISALYGAQFDASRYLHRFFDQTYRFEDAQREPLVELHLSKISAERISSPPDISPVAFIGAAFDAMKLSPRDVEQCVHILNNCITVWQNKTPIELVTMLPLVVAQQRRLIPSFAGAFKSELDQQLGPVRNWGHVRVKFPARYGEAKAYDGWTVFERFVSIINGGSLLDLDKVDNNSPLTRWALEVFRKELQIRFSGGFNTKRPPTSLMTEYPKLVRSVGRLTPAQ